MIQIFLISSIFFAAKKFTTILCEVNEKNTNRRVASAVSENHRRNGFIYQEHEDLIIVLNIHRTKGSFLPLLLPAQYQKPNQGEWNWEWAALWMVKQTPYWPTMIILVYITVPFRALFRAFFSCHTTARSTKNGWKSFLRMILLCTMSKRRKSENPDVHWRMSLKFFGESPK